MFGGVLGQAFKRVVGSILGVVALASVTIGGFAYNDAGYCQHVRTIFGTESSVCEAGWYFEGWGWSNQWPWAITIAHSTNPEADGSSVSAPREVRMADNWMGHVTQVTRFEIPQGEDEFLNMSRKFRTPERLISSVLLPAVTSSLDSVSNMFTMEEYYSGGKRDQYKTEFRDAIESGRPVVRQVSKLIDTGVGMDGARANDSDVAEPTSSAGDATQLVTVTEKILDERGVPLREAHDYQEFGIISASAILENLDPDDTFEEQIKARKEAASRRIVAREQRKEQEEQRILAIQAGQTAIAKRQAAAEVEQIEKTTNAETTKKLALIEAERMREEARIAKETSEINLEKARIDAQAVQVAADAEAYQKREILEADGALAQKLDALVRINAEWASAASQIKVPQTVFTGSGDTSTGNAMTTVDQFMQMMMVKSARDLQVDPSIKQ
jgi:hypothetical protein